MSHVRTATKQDAERILIVKNKAQKDGYKNILDQVYLDSLDITPERIYNFQQWIEKCEIFLVYEEENSLLGFICGGNTWDEETPCPYVLGGFYVDPEHQRRGIWQQLFDTYQQLIEGNKFYLRTFSQSKGEKFYLKQGGKTFGEKQTIIGTLSAKEIWFIFG